MRLRYVAGVIAAALAVGGSIAVADATQPDPSVEAQLEQVEAQVDALGARFAVASETEQNALLVEIGSLQDERFQLCGQLSTDSAARDLYC